MNVDSPRARLSPAPTRVNTRSQTPMRALRAGDEAAHLRQDDRQRHLADQRRLARHVRAGDDQHLLRRWIQADVVGDERAGRRQALDDRMAGVGQIDDAAVVDVRAAVARRGARPRRAPPARRPRRRAPRARAAGRRRRHRRAQPREDLQLERDPPLVGGEDRLLELGQLRRHEALGVGDRLLAPVVGGHRREVRARDLDVVAEHAVVLDLQRRDAGALALARLDGGDAIAAARGDVAQLVELRRHARGRSRRPWSRRARRRAARAPSSAAISAARSSPSDSRLSFWRQRAADLAGVRGRERRASVGQARERAPSAARSRGVATPRRARPTRRSMSATSVSTRRAASRAPCAATRRSTASCRRRMARDVDQRKQQPAPQQAPAHRGPGLVEHLDQRPGPPAIEQRLGQLQVAARLLVDDQGVGAAVDARGARPAARPPAASRARSAAPRPPPRPPAASVRRARRPRRSRARARARPPSSPGATVVRGTAPWAARTSSISAWPSSSRPNTSSRGATRAISSTAPRTVAASVARKSPVVTSRNARPKPPRASPDDGGHVAGRARIQRLLVEDHARRDDADDVALDDALHRPRILELLAHRDPVAELGQLHQVRPHRVVRDAAHGDGIFLALVARGQREVEDARDVDRVLVEHLVEVAQPEEDDRVRVPRLDVQVLAHQRRRSAGLRLLHQPVPGSAPASTRLLLGGGGFLLRRLGRRGGRLARGGALLGQPCLELFLSRSPAHLHRPPIVSSSHRPEILVRARAVKAASPLRALLSCGAARANRVRMQLPTLRRPIAASALAGILGAGIVDALQSAGGAAGQVFLLALGLYGAFALVAAFGGAVLAAALDGARPPGWGKLRDDPGRDRAVAAGILACLVGALVVAVVAAAGQRLFVGKMQSQKLATIAAGGLVAIGALPGALVAITTLPLLRRIAHALPRPRALGATGVLLITIGVVALLGFVAALSRADWRVLDLGPLYALALAVVLGFGHGLFWFGSATGRALRTRFPARLTSALSFAIAIVAFACLMIGARLPEGSPGFAAAADGSWGMRFLLGVARRATDGDGDGFSARFGGGDCDDTRGDVYPGRRRTSPATAWTRTARAATPRGRTGATATDDAGKSADAIAPVAPRADGFKGNLLVITIDALRGDRLGVAGYGRPSGKSLTPTLDALARKGAYFKRAWAQAPNTPKSFPAILTGRYPSDIAWDKPGINYPNLLPTNHTFYETLAAAGWKPIGIFSHFYFTPDRGISRGFAEWSNEGAGTIAESNKDIASPRIVPQGDRAAAPGRRAQGTLRALDAPVRAPLLVHDAQGVPDLALRRPRADGEVRLRDRVLRHVAQEADRCGQRARPGRQHRDRHPRRSRRGMGRAQGLLPRPGPVRRAAARAADHRRAGSKAPGDRRASDAGRRRADGAGPGGRADPGEHARAQPACRASRRAKPPRPQRRGRCSGSSCRRPPGRTTRR